jgi:integrase
MPLKWSDLDFDGLTLLVQRSIVHGRVADVKTEYSRDRVPLDPALAEMLLKYKHRCYPTPVRVALRESGDGQAVQPGHDSTETHPQGRNTGRIR